ncbi:uncharacterized protein [Arachis hypogaea]|uniref:uncharacterized protein n=1 Tax=Arachis hypogaea TaxID=3818 RepID=UPI003B220640
MANEESLENPSSNMEDVFSLSEIQNLARLLNQFSNFQSFQNRSDHSSSSNANVMLDPSSPYYLHPGENPGISIVNVTLNASNYHSWTRAMRLALKSKNKLSFIDESLPKPEESDMNFLTWEKCNTYVIAWLNLSLSSEISQSVIWNENACDMWNDLEHRYHQGDIFRVAELEEEMYAASCYKKYGPPPHMRQMQRTINCAATLSRKDSEKSSEALQTLTQKGDSKTSHLLLSQEQKDTLLALLQQDNTLQPNQITNPNPSLQPGFPTYTLTMSSQISHILFTKTFSPHTWVIDSGATDHVSFSLANFYSYQHIKPILVKLPNGHQTITNIAGTVIFSNKLYLTGVLYIPCFTFNLLSVSKAAKQLKCHFSISDTTCEVQDRSTWKIIGYANENGGLYTLTIPALTPQSSNSTALTSSHPKHTSTVAGHITHTTSGSSTLHIADSVKDITTLWHFRLGHIPIDRMHVIKRNYPLIEYTKNMKPCDFCHFAKQKNLPFVNSRGTEGGKAGRLAGGGETEETPRCCVVVKQGRLHVAAPW